MTDSLSHTPTTKPAAMPPCVWCGASRADQIGVSYYDAQGEPLCLPCWEREYGEDYRKQYQPAETTS
ncbi:MAG: hypothetical protein M0Z28_18275 [Rhodospirillales bacterium]|nr:hypothetical protein [Rhodospirillales bacterium]